MEWYLARKRAVMEGRVKPTSLPLHRFYRFAATALGASMWFFVGHLHSFSGKMLLVLLLLQPLLLLSLHQKY